MRTRFVPFIAAGLIVAACSSSGEPVSTTVSTTPPSSTSTTAAVSSTTTTVGSTTTSAAPTPTFPEFRIVRRIIDPETGDIVVLLLDPDSYTSLSDLDLYDVIADAVDRFPPIFEAHVVDTRAAADAVLVEEPDAAQQAELAGHCLARLEDGFRIVYLGPFDGSDDAVLGS